MASTSASNKVRQGTFIAPSFMGVVESASTAAGLDQANQQPENYNTQMTVRATIDPISHASSFGPINAFILGPGRPPITPKVVSLILANKFVEMSELLPENLEGPMVESSSFTIERGSIVPVTKVSVRSKQEVSDILTWVECFTRELCGRDFHFPSNPAHARDLVAYMALIIRMAKHYTIVACVGLTTIALSASKPQRRI